VTDNTAWSLLGRRASFLLSQIGARSADSFAERLAPLGLRPSEFGLLVALSAGQGASQQQLADGIGVHRNAMVGLVDSLEERGLVERRPHPSDRRAHAIHLTTAGRDVLRRAERLADQQEADLLKALTPDERARLVESLQRLADHVGLIPGVHPGLQAQ
jgi:DNA-binding MarR family transcriptional regulator